MREAAQAGTGVVYHTPDLDELIETSDRIVVVFEGRVSEVALDRDAVGRAMLGAS
jgi:ABC-type sugar transport system ATPase subunit